MTNSLRNHSCIGAGFDTQVNGSHGAVDPHSPTVGVGETLSERVEQRKIPVLDARNCRGVVFRVPARTGAADDRQSNRIVRRPGRDRASGGFEPMDCQRRRGEGRGARCMCLLLGAKLVAVLTVSVVSEFYVRQVDFPVLSWRSWTTIASMQAITGFVR